VTMSGGHKRLVARHSQTVRGMLGYVIWASVLISCGTETPRGEDSPSPVTLSQADSSFCPDLKAMLRKHQQVVSGPLRDWAAGVGGFASRFEKDAELYELAGSVQMAAKVRRLARALDDLADAARSEEPDGVFTDRLIPALSVAIEDIPEETCL
jgi:hypothetical protein